MLYLIATPIGNLGDITYRAITTLKECDYLLAEDTRRTRILLHHYKIECSLVSFHLFNEKKKEDRVIADLKAGKKIGLVSDAGMPTLNDPGSMLIARCQKEELPYTILPGASSILSALASSGLSYDKFQFLGFLPKKSGKRKKMLASALEYEGATITFESPYRIVKVLKELVELKCTKEIVIARELTKKFETLLRANCEELLAHFEKNVPKGEFVLIISN